MCGTAKDAPHYVPGVITMSVAMIANTVVIVFWRLWLVYQNRRRSKIVAEMGLTTEEAERRGQELGAQDVTDVDNPFFRSVWRCGTSKFQGNRIAHFLSRYSM